MPGYQINGPLIKVSGLGLTLDGKEILRDVNAEVHDYVSVDRPDLKTPQIISFLGPSGIGKTQFSLCLAGLQQSTIGTVLVGPDLQPTKPGLVGMVAQNYPLLMHRTVLGNLIKSGTQAGMSRSEATAAAMEYLQTFGLMAEKDKYPVQLSGGQQQRVAIIQQLLCSKHYLVLDEPLSGLDVNNKRIVCEQLVKMGRLDELNTFIIVSHDIKFTLAISNTVWLMGRDRTPEGEVIPGAKIQHRIDLNELGICGLDNPECIIQNDPRFNELVRDIELRIFPTL